MCAIHVLHVGSVFYSTRCAAGGIAYMAFMNRTRLTYRRTHAHTGMVAATHLTRQVEVGPRACEALHHRQMPRVCCLQECSVAVLPPRTPHVNTAPTSTPWTAGSDCRCVTTVQAHMPVSGPVCVFLYVPIHVCVCVCIFVTMIQ